MQLFLDISINIDGQLKERQQEAESLLSISFLCLDDVAVCNKGVIAECCSPEMETSTW